MNSLCPLLNREIPVQSHNIDQHPMKLFAEFSGDLNKVKKPLWTIYLKKLNTEIFFLSKEEVVLSSGGFSSWKIGGVCVCVWCGGEGGGRVSQSFGYLN